MATYPEYELSDLAAFSGEDEAAYTRPGYVASALEQAFLLFEIGTCLTEWPDDTKNAKIAKFAVLSMADAIYWVQPFQKVLRNPFSSETIGSYSYSKLSSAVSAGLPTGVSWFDLAVSTIGVCDFGSGIPLHGGINVHEEDKTPHDGYGVFLGPDDQTYDSWGSDFTGSPSTTPEVP
jgi:hypothetical protein